MNNRKHRRRKKRAKSSLSHTDLVSLYSQQWEQIRHLDSLDFRMMALLPIVVGVLTVGIQLIGNTNAQIPKNVLLIVTVLVVGISFAGCYTTFRNWLCYMRRFAILNALEGRMGMLKLKIIVSSRQFVPPKGFCAFNLAMIKSIRFPLATFYSILGGCGVILFTENVAWASIGIGLLVAFIIFGCCNGMTYLSYRKEFRSEEDR